MYIMQRGSSLIKNVPLSSTLTKLKPSPSSSALKAPCPSPPSLGSSTVSSSSSSSSSSLVPRPSSSSHYNHSNSGSKSSFAKKATLLALPAFLVASEFETVDTDDKENNYARPSLKSSLSSLYPLKTSGGFLTPIDHDTRMCIGVSIIPHPAKRAKGGEDAYFISEDMKSIGIADGVGGWGDIGVDPALYSRMLMASGKYVADSLPPSACDPVQIMTEAYEHSTEIQGSATCCIVVLDGYCLKTANLGDSGFMVIRGNDIVFRSKEQQHSFNFPYQLGTGSADLPCHAVSITVNIQPGDLIILGTDGLFDNLFDDEIVEITTQATEPMNIAQLIARQAHVAASSKALISPFAKAARENGYPLATGGKMDDISVVVARVVLSSDGNITSFAA